MLCGTSPLWAYSNPRLIIQIILITMFFGCLFAIWTWGFTIVMQALPGILLSALLEILTWAYVIHYSRFKIVGEGC
jgi:hypothetical protein